MDNFYAFAIIKCFWEPDPEPTLLHGNVIG